LLEVLHRLTDLGNSIIIIEHNLDVIRNADWILDLGPEGGEDGGRVVGEGRPAKIAATPGSFTGEFLARYYASHNGKLSEIPADEISSNGVQTNGSLLKNAFHPERPTPGSPATGLRGRGGTGAEGSAVALATSSRRTEPALEVKKATPAKKSKAKKPVRA
jgi:excinuclease ABC subunit A